MSYGAKIYGDTNLFGVRVSFAADSGTVLQAALLPWRVIGGNAEESVHIDLGLYAVNPSIADHDLVEDGRLRMVRGGVLADADGRTGRASIRHAPGTEQSAAFAETVETVMLFLVAQAGRIPLHASAVMMGDTAIVMAGPSGMGKSSLAHAADSIGLPLLSDDTVYIQTRPRLRVWARSRAIHLLEQDAPAAGTMRFRSGRWKRALPVSRPVPMAEHAMLCVLARGERAALARLSSDDAVGALTTAPEPGYDFYGARSADAVRALAARGCWRLTLSRDPAAAMALLCDTFLPAVPA